MVLCFDCIAGIGFTSCRVCCNHDESCVQRVGAESQRLLKQLGARKLCCSIGFAAGGAASRHAVSQHKICCSNWLCCKETMGAANTMLLVAALGQGAAFFVAGMGHLCCCSKGGVPAAAKGGGAAEKREDGCCSNPCIHP